MKKENKKPTKKEETAFKTTLDRIKNLPADEEIQLMEIPIVTHKISKAVIEKRFLGTNVMIEMTNVPANVVKETVNYLVQ